MESLKVAVIGAGPGGMFFCHALETMKEETNKDIRVTCFERSTRPGGIWRSAKSSSDIITSSTDMYDNLWMNGPSHCIEFFDYTFDEHFGRPVTVYLKRQELLDYITGRVTKKCPDFFNRYCRFNSEVIHVKFDSDMQQFVITVKDLLSGETDTECFDKCLWACGENSKRKMPQKLVDLFRNGGFNGRIIHSSDTATLEDDVRGKRILLIGGGFSAEDMTLQTIKLGADKVYVCTRLPNSEVTWTTRWPMDKVTVLRCQEPMAVKQNGKCIQFRKVSWTFDGYEVDDECTVSSSIKNINTVIFCTGYVPYLDFLDEDLRKGYPGGEEYFSRKFMFDAPKNWKMPDCLFTELTGEVKLSSRLKFLTWRVHPEFFHGVLISNPNMMFLSCYQSDHPLLAMDTYAWLLASYVTGRVQMPSQDKMQRINREEAISMLKYPYIRYMMDENYCHCVNNLPNFWDKDGYEYPDLWDEAVHEYELLGTQKLAWIMEEAKYPFRIGTRYELNENAKTMLVFGDQSYYHRDNQQEAVGDERNWKTFRDYTDGEKFYSLFTGTHAVSMKRHWLDDNNGVERKTANKLQSSDLKPQSSKLSVSTKMDIVTKNEAVGGPVTPSKVLAN